MKIKELVEKYGEDYEIKIAFYSSGEHFILNLDELDVVRVNHDKKVIVFDGAFN